jgi:hypothetical protein
MGSVSAVEAAASIRQALKAKRITSRQVSVRADQYSMGSTIRVDIKDARIQKAMVEEIAKAHERVDRDSSSGEILCGGNRFVDVHYTSEAIAPIAAEVLALLQTLNEGEGVDYRGFRISVPRNAPHYARFSARHPALREYENVSCHGMEHCARQVADLILSRGLS